MYNSYYCIIITIIRMLIFLWICIVVLVNRHPLLVMSFIKMAKILQLLSQRLFTSLFVRCPMVHRNKIFLKRYNNYYNNTHNTCMYNTATVNSNMYPSILQHVQCTLVHNVLYIFYTFQFSSSSKMAKMAGSPAPYTKCKKSIKVTNLLTFCIVHSLMVVFLGKFCYPKDQTTKGIPNTYMCTV